MSTDLTFTAAMVQMRTGLLPEPSLEQGTKLIREAAAEGADYVQTPEVSNMMQVNRKALFEHLAAEEDDLSLKAYRALAAELKIHLHIGSLALRATPERAVNRSFLIGPDGAVIASYDKIHMFDIDLPGGESYRESANYQPGETAVISDLPWGRIGLTICYDVRFPALYRALAESGAVVPHRALRLHPQDRRGALAHAAARPRHREWLLRVRRSAGRPAREQARDLWPFADRRPLGRGARRRRRRARRCSWRRSIPPRSRPRARPCRRCSMAGVSASPIPRPAPNICTWCGDRHDPLQSALRTRPRVRKLVSELGGL